MNRSKRKCQLVLIVLFSLLIFFILLITVMLSGIVVYGMIKKGVISGYQQTLSGVPLPLIFMGIVSLIIGSVCAVLVGNIPLKPVSRLINQMDRLASGDFKVRMRPSSRNRVFDDVSRSFNKMAEELENTEMLRSDFINNFSHEFKTPIVSIAGFAKLLRKGNLTEEQKAEYIAIIEEESLRLSAMATNVLNLTKVENQTILTEISEFNLSEQLRSCILLLVDKWEKKQIEFKLDFREHMISANEELLKQAWINLIDNAIKFSPEGGLIELALEETENQISVSVINAGEEIPPEDRERIFKKFYQADKSHSSEGNGIGLAIVKRVAELHRGSTQVQSEDGFTRFTVTLPKKAQDKF